MPGSEKSLALDLHRQLERAGKHPGKITRPLFNKLFQDRLNRRILRNHPVGTACPRLA